MTSAIVVGSGPNGLGAAAVLARAGVDVTVLEAADTIGGGTRSSQLTVPGLVHDDCSAVHPMVIASPLFRRLQLDGLTWRNTDVDCAHPLDDGTAGAFARSFDRTDELLGADGARWRRLFGAPAAHFDDLFDDVSQPLLRVPRHPFTLARFGAPATLPATVLAKAFASPQARALWMGVAAHAFWRLDRPMSSVLGMALTSAGHAHGWVVAEGGSQAIADALAADIVRRGGTIETGIRVTSAADLPPRDALLLDVSPSVAAGILGDGLPSRVARAYRRFRHGAAAFKVDFAVEGGVPWTAPAARVAGTVHLGGDALEVAANELEVHRGRMPDRPFVLVGQQYLADPGRSMGDVHPLWTYAHVPHGFTGDATEAIVAQIERFAPGFRDRVVATAVRSTTELSRYNSNYVGGDIIGGASSFRQVVFRPRVAIDPYATGIDGVYLCSASTPPGAGAHGMCGANAAARALRHLGIRTS
ncbi:phytoene desaturase family protein [Desertimonas flava]|uniref:phytoene desaturase family protein n=1 Tax=Desertimonas flava TaxID=2064846 RepID=UPI000E34864E|nr:NAD(P)/FAD-dependent oxidoreductase [Desertimonas flava]